MMSIANRVLFVVTLAVLAFCFSHVNTSFDVSSSASTVSHQKAF